MLQCQWPAERPCTNIYTPGGIRYLIWIYNLQMTRKEFVLNCPHLSDLRLEEEEEESHYVHTATKGPCGRVWHDV